MARYGLGYEFAMDQTGEISTLYEVTSTPTTYFIAPDGTIADTTAGVVSQDWLNRNIDKYLGT